MSARPIASVLFACTSNVIRSRLAAELARTEGIIAALESSHAIAKAMQLAADMSPQEHLVVCLSGRGDKDAMEIARLRGEAF